MTQSRYVTVESSLCTGLAVTSGSLCVTVPICYSRELFMHRVSGYSEIPLCHNPDMLQERALYARGQRLQRDPFVSQSLYVTVESSLCTGSAVTSGSLCVTIPICYSRELFMHRVSGYSGIPLCHNPYTLQ